MELNDRMPGTPEALIPGLDEFANEINKGWYKEKIKRKIKIRITKKGQHITKDMRIENDDDSPKTC